MCQKNRIRITQDLSKMWKYLYNVTSILRRVHTGSEATLRTRCARREATWLSIASVYFQYVCSHWLRSYARYPSYIACIVWSVTGPAIFSKHSFAYALRMPVLLVFPVAPPPPLLQWQFITGHDRGKSSTLHSHHLLLNKPHSTVSHGCSHWHSYISAYHHTQGLSL